MSDPTPGGAATQRYNEIRARTTNTTKRKNLERIWAALEAIRAEAVRQKRPAEYTQSAVLRRLQEAGTRLGENTIRNRGQGDDYRALIEEYRNQYGTISRANNRGDDDDLPLAISDQRIAARVRAVVRQNRSLKERNDILHEQYQRLVSSRPPPALPTPVLALPAPPSPVGPREAAAVRHFLDHLPELHWHIHEASGAILDRYENEVAPPGFAQALRRIAGVRSSTQDLVLLPADAPPRHERAAVTPVRPSPRKVPS